MAWDHDAARFQLDTATIAEIRIGIEQKQEYRLAGVGNCLSYKLRGQFDGHMLLGNSSNGYQFVSQCLGDCGNIHQQVDTLHLLLIESANSNY